MKKAIIPEEFKHYVDEKHFSPIIESHGTYYLSGVTGTKQNQSISRDPEEQFHDAFYKLGVYLESAALSYEHILQMTTFHIQLKKHIKLFSEVKDQYITAPYPAWAAIGVSDFVPEHALVEMSIIARQ